ncbi:MAG TPA: hypothetical protein VGR02_12225 [Thermoanaerobaculia bacterium]|jgi:hypothetical protein|nr:hypothetical protein [Thermoanaerobaculia bacterium]
MLKPVMFTALLVLGAALLAPAARAECTLSNPVTYIDITPTGDGYLIELTTFWTVTCPTASSGGGSGSTSHPGVYQWHSSGGHYGWTWTVGGVQVGHGSGTLSHVISSADDPELYVELPEPEFDDPRQIAPPPD